MWHPCILTHTVIIMLLSPESRKGCSSVGSVNSEREQLTPKSSPTQIKTNFAVLQINVVFIPFFPRPVAFHTNSWELVMVLSGKKLIQLPLIKQLLGYKEHYLSPRLSVPPSVLQNLINLWKFSKSEKAEAVEIWQTYLIICMQPIWILHKSLTASAFCFLLTWFRYVGSIHMGRGYAA